MPEFTWRPGVRLKKKAQGDAQIVGEELQRIKAENRLLTAALVVSEAREKESPLNPYFTWDDTEAAEEYRQVQARHLIRAVQIVHPEPKKEDTWHSPLFTSVEVVLDDGLKHRHYETTEVVVGDDALLIQAKAEAEKAVRDAQTRLGILCKMAEEEDFHQAHDHVSKARNLLKEKD